MPTIKAQPKSVGTAFPNRYLGQYNDTATITEVSVVDSKNKPELKGCIAVHIRGNIMQDNGIAKEVHLVDWYGKKKPTTPELDFAQQMLNRAVNAQKSAGVEAFDGEIDTKDVRKKVLEIFNGLVGKQVTVSQYYKEGFNKPNINYRYIDEDETGEAEEDEELPL